MDPTWTCPARPLMWPVAEVKRRKADVKGDIKKTTRYWFSPPLLYRFGAVVVINDKEAPHVTVLENAAPVAST